MLKRNLFADLEAFSGCGWAVASATRPELEQIAASAAGHGGGAAVVASCQRFEVFHHGGCGCTAPQRWSGRDALQRMAEVAAGLHSLVLGEEQILGQVRSGVAEAGAAVQEFGGIAIAAARSLRHQNQFDAHTGHLLDRALTQAGVAPRGRILIVGAGSVGRLVTLRAVELGFTQITVAARREPEGAWFDRDRMRFAPLARLREAGKTDVIVTCLGSAAGELDADHDLPLATQLVVDLGTPRNIVGATAVPVMTVATMLAEAAGHRHRDVRRARLRGQLSDILDRRLEMAASDSQSPVGVMRAEIERVRQAEMARVRRMHPELPEATIDAITRSLVNQIFHRPSARMKQIDDPALAARFAALFAEEESGRREPGAGRLSVPEAGDASGPPAE